MHARIYTTFCQWVRKHETHVLNIAWIPRLSTQFWATFKNRMKPSDSVSRWNRHAFRVGQISVEGPDDAGRAFTTFRLKRRKWYNWVSIGYRSGYRSKSGGVLDLCSWRFQSLGRNPSTKVSQTLQTQIAAHGMKTITEKPKTKFTYARSHVKLGDVLDDDGEVARVSF